MNKEELKHEAEEYVKQNYCEVCVMADDCKCGCIDCFTVQAYLASAEPREKQIADLEKENAELKAFRQDCVKLTEDNVVIVRQRAETSNQLTKAKELLEKLLVHSKRYIWIADDSNKPIMQKEIAEAEQFLKEVEK